MSASRSHTSSTTTVGVSVRRLAATCLAGLALAGAAGCGGDDAPEPGERGGKAQAPTGAAPPTPAATPAPRFDAQTVADFFRDVTGDPLEVEGGESFDSLRLDRSDYERSLRLSERYGSFSLLVLDGAAGRELYETDGSQPVRPDAQGIYWHGGGGAWRAVKPYAGGSVVLDWSADEGRSVDERFERLDTVLSALGRPAAEARAALPAEDRPCDAPDAGRTCRDADGATVTTVDRAEPLELPGLRVRVLKVQSGRLVYPGTEYGLVKRAKGVFVLAGMRLRNTGDEPLRSLYAVKLRIGRRTYDQDAAAGFTATPPNTFPIQPGDSGLAAVVFDIPRSALADAKREGAIAFPADEQPSSLDSAFRIGQIRLGGPAASAGGERTPASYA